MEKLNQDRNKIIVGIIKNEDAEYQIPKKESFVIEIIFRLIYFFIGILITCLLYSKCMFNPNCNPIVVVFFSILGLLFFGAAGLPIDKLANIKLT